MLLYRRPAEPEGFAERMRPFRERVEASVHTGDKPTFEDAAWRQRPYKQALAKAQKGKCAYCEVVATEIGDIEHFRPKGAISELDDDPETWGREVPLLANVEGRRTRQISPQGYWWLAYEWTNLLFACTTCNRLWKGSLFPVQESQRLLPPSPDRPETPLLLDPYGSESPSRHLRFTGLGQVEARDRSRVGFETIRTLGLDRPQLQRDREEKAQRTHDCVRRLKEAESVGDVRRILRDVLTMGSEAYPHAGMVRIVFEQETGLSWSDIEP